MLPRKEDPVASRILSSSPGFSRRSRPLGSLGFRNDLTFHDLRHEATSRFFEKGFNVMEVAAITGHKTLQMLKRYTHLKAEELAERMK